MIAPAADTDAFPNLSAAAIVYGTSFTSSSATPSAFTGTAKVNFVPLTSVPGYVAPFAVIFTLVGSSSPPPTSCTSAVTVALASVPTSEYQPPESWLLAAGPSISSRICTGAESLLLPAMPQYTVA